jgi:hypothetical protein
MAKTAVHGDRLRSPARLGLAFRHAEVADMRWKIRILVLALASAAGLAVASEAADARPDRRLAEAARAIRRADYRGDRAELRRWAEALADIASPADRAYREYWEGFAYWRRALNGFNETPTPPDLLDDLERCTARERAALALDAGFEDARGALLGCLMNEMFLERQLPAEKRTAVARELGENFRAVASKSEANPRILWLIGGNEIFAPPPWGGDAARGIATYRKGLEAARREALSPAPREDWVPSWGAPEILMSLAYVHTHGPSPNAAVARAYAEGALAMVPDWHYVRDVLLTQIDALSNPPAPAPKKETGKPEGGSR